MKGSRSLLLTLCVGLLTGIAPAALAGDAAASMTISVQVVARTMMTIETQPASVNITAEDVTRGYVDLPSAVAFRVRSNARAGYAIEFEPLSGPFSHALVRWGSTQAAITNRDGSWVVQPQAPRVEGSMAVRLTLAPGTEPGSYAWPLLMDARSL